MCMESSGQAFNCISLLLRPRVEKGNHTRVLWDEGIVTKVLWRPRYCMVKGIVIFCSNQFIVNFFCNRQKIINFVTDKKMQENVGTRVLWDEGIVTKVLWRTRYCMVKGIVIFCSNQIIVNFFCNRQKIINFLTDKKMQENVGTKVLYMLQGIVWSKVLWFFVPNNNYN